ncbi:uncharacterized protein [Euphorbia lathyris]|uniref:uncharacterized protein n=1 Tax=Euphorbia lathyris TaxID=212925 RepID=UPI0033135DDE
MSTNSTNSATATSKTATSNTTNTDTVITTHPALNVSNISTFIKITLDIEKGQYPTWAALFKLHATAFQVLDHILPPPNTPTLQQSNPDLWTRIDAVVLQWIYSTISLDLLNTIIVADSTAARAWTQLQEIFSDNKHSRALFLQQEFSKLKLDSLSDISSYCQQLKSLSDQLSNVDCPVTNDQIVLQLISGLTDAYDTVGTQIRHGDPLPSFQKAPSMLILEETARSRKTTPPSDPVALTATSAESANSPAYFPPARPALPRPHHQNRGGRHGSRHHYRGRGYNRGGPRYSGSPSYRTPYNLPWGYSLPLAPQQPWAAPPCPYPTNNWPTQSPSGRPQYQLGILGPRPNTPPAHLSMITPSYTPTDIAEAMHTMSIAPPSDQWHMDTGATSHMTAQQGFTDGQSYHEM